MEILTISMVMIFLTLTIVSILFTRGSTRIFVLFLDVVLLFVSIGALLRTKFMNPELDPSLKIILEYEEVTGRNLLPPELDSLRKRKESGEESSRKAP